MFKPKTNAEATAPVQFLNTTRAAEILHLGADSLRRLVRTGQIGYRRTATGRLLFSADDLTAYQCRGEYHAPANRG